MPSRDEIGRRGESIFVVRVTQSCGPKQEILFRPQFLGDKFATLDHLIELTGLPGRSAYFFAQVRATNLGLTRTNPRRLRVSVSQEDVDRMIAYPAPTYVVGVDNRSEEAYIISANGTSMEGMSSMPIAYPLNVANLQLLWSEVERFWRRRKMILNDSAFTI